MDTLSIERIWEDTDFFQIEVLAQSEHIYAKTRSYTNVALINELSSRLATFPQRINDRYKWENGIKGDSSTPFVSFEFWCEDKLGHILVEVYMEIDDGASYDVHNCCLFIRTEIGLLNDFGKELASLNEEGVGKNVTL